MSARARRVAVSAAACAALLAACSTAEDPAPPAACATSSEAVVRALRAAPDPVTLEDGVPISACFARGSESGDLQTLGFSLTEAAAELAARARSSPGSPATLELGYLVGAMRRGAGGTPGIHEELLRRVELELRGVDTSSEAFATGERAGRETG